MDTLLTIATDRKFYNRNRKEFFLSDYSRKSTQDYYGYVLERACTLETKLNRDLSEFNLNEVHELLHSLDATSVYSLASQVSVFDLYTSFCIKNDLQETDTNVSYFKSFKTSDLDIFVNKGVHKNQYFKDKKDYEVIIDNLENAQDKVIFALLYEGAKGDEYDEILNLKKEDCYLDEGYILLRRDKPKKVKDPVTGEEKEVEDVRALHVSKETAKIIQDAIDENDYSKNNGDSEGMKNPIVPLADTGYIIRPTGTYKEGRVKRQTFLHRISNVAKWFGNPYLTATNVWVSGQVQMAREMKANLGRDLKYTDYYEINNRFGMREDYWNRTKKRVKDYLD